MIFPRSTGILVVIVATLVHFCESSEPFESDVKELGEESYNPDIVEAQERKFSDVKQWKLSHLASNKKSWLTSLFTRSPEPETTTIHELTPLEQYPIWKIHKYKGIELRPAQLINLPTSLHYLSTQRYSGSLDPAVEYLQPTIFFSAPGEQHHKAPHIKYDLPHVELSVPAAAEYVDDNVAPQTIQGSAGKIAQTSDGPTQLQILSSLGSLTSLPAVHESADNSRTLLSAHTLLKSDNSLVAKLKNLKSWKLGLKEEPEKTVAMPLMGHLSDLPLLSSPHLAETLSLPELPEVEEITVKGLENLNIQVPEIPNINFPSFASAVTSGPYLKVNVDDSLPALNYGLGTVQYVPPNPYYQSHAIYQQFPETYYGYPPLYDSYGNQLSSDAYTSASSNQVPSFAALENSAFEMQPQISQNLLSGSQQSKNFQLQVDRSHKNLTTNSIIQSLEDLSIESKGRQETFEPDVPHNKKVSTSATEP